MRLFLLFIICFTNINLAHAQAQLELMEVKQPQEPYGYADIIVEANTYKPAFYKGRSEPVVGSTLQLIAITGGYEPSEDLTYSWSINNKPSYKSEKPTYTLIAPEQNEILVELVITDSKDRLVARSSKYVQQSKPQIVFYLENPLRGISSVAITDSYLLSAEEMILKAEPYFIDSEYQNSSVVPSWKIDGKIADTEEDWRKINIKKEDAEQHVQFSIYNKYKLGQRASTKINILPGL